MSDFRDAVQRMQQAALDKQRRRIVCPHCHESRLEKLRPHGDGEVYCLTCDAQFEVKE